MPFGKAQVSIILIISLLISLTVHEAAHAYVAFKLGDDTAKNEGRLTLNPLAHLDPIGTLSLIFFRIGWGKPVPVNPNNFKNPSLHNFFVALSGPASNLALSLIAAILLRIFSQNDLVTSFLSLFIVLNTFLMIFNLLPIPPLDGSKIWHLVLNDEAYYTLERMGPLILIAVLLFSFTFGGIFSIIENISFSIVNLLT
ncbi:MAG: Peptidase family M50 [candidate division WS2 bacterium ADurb.Bin280]|uniref:Peptidase family M50 n=1 Tax=candidate division WS2 bacterium ADurb.Bin280 TaxID=1852829 RepID=A0A1V5SF57_9BACT|nr:MAG: Peptidase family M50 [candidate division WS2 bacterium ADurb.Bin280]